MTQFVKVPKERIAVIIGPSGSTKKKIEELSKVKLEVSSEDGRVEINEETKEIIEKIKQKTDADTIIEPDSDEEEKEIPEKTEEIKENEEEKTE